MRFLFRLFAFFFALFILPSIVHLAIWSLKYKPQGWRQANWSSADILPAAHTVKEAKIYVFSARTGGLKGAFATHSWLVLKPENATHYDRYDVVGWGNPVRRNAYDPDGRWYSNTPEINREISGAEAEALIPKIEQAIVQYPWSNRGDYTLWPGPNSNTFVASIIRAVPGFDARTVSTAVGRDFPVNGAWVEQDKSNALRMSLGGYAGLVLGWEDGLDAGFSDATLEF